MGQPDPFDFSDFGAAPSPPTHPSRGPGSPGHTFAGSFDPFDSPAPGRGGQPGHGPGPQDDIFHQPAPALRSLTTAGPPWPLIFGALACAVLGAVASAVDIWVPGTPTLAMIGWVLAGPIAIGVLAAFTRVDTHRRTVAVYSAGHWIRTGYWGVLATCLVGVGIAAWQIALWAGRL